MAPQHASQRHAPAHAEPDAGYAQPSSGSDPFGGGSSFDPELGNIGGSDLDIKPRRSTGLIIFTALVAAGVGGLMGYTVQARQGVMNKAKVGTAKGKQMAEEVERISQIRKRISLKWPKIKAKLDTNPAEAAKDLSTVIEENFKNYPKVDALFGWQLGSMHKKSIRSTFNLYEEGSGLVLDLSRLALFLNANSGVLAEGAGAPTTFAVLLDDDKGASLVEYVEPICNLEEKTPCPPGKAKKAVGHAVRLGLGSAPAQLFPSEKVQPLKPSGPIFQFAIGLKPEMNAKGAMARLVAQVDARLESMNKYEKVTVQSLERYVSAPTVDANTAQPDPTGQ